MMGMKAFAACPDGTTNGSSQCSGYGYLEDEEAGEPLPNFGETEGHLATRAAVGQHQE
jgi:hypothetical protein